MLTVYILKFRLYCGVERVTMLRAGHPKNCS